MGFVAAIVVSLITAILGELLRPKQKPQNAKASSIDEFDLPTAQEGGGIPIIAGKCKVDGPNVTWYGDLSITAIKKKIKTGWFSSATQILGYKYRIGIHMAVAHGRDDFRVHEIRFGDKMPAHTRSVEADGATRFVFNDENFYGGPEKEGGVAGVVRFYPGNSVQTSNAYMSSELGEEFPAYRGLAHAVFERTYVGTSAYIKPVGFIVSSYPNQLGMLDNKHMIGPVDDEDCNPICFIYEVLTNRVWGASLNPVDIDLEAFRAAAYKVFDEGYGVSMIYNGGSSAKDLIEELLRHIDAVMFSDPQTGLLTIRLARADYDVTDLPVYGKDDFIDGIKFTRPSWNETRNTLKGTYIDRNANYTEAVVSQQELANIQQRGGEIAMDEVDFRGFTQYAPAALAVARALKTMSYPLAKVTGQLSRKAWKTKPGDVFVLNWPERGIDMLVVRVILVGYGNLRSNVIDIEAVEDIFSISEIAYDEPAPSGWVDPVGPPAPLLRQYLFELPPEYTLGVQGAFLATLGSSSSQIDEGYQVHSGVATGALTYKQDNLGFTPSATIAAGYSGATADRDATGFAVSIVRHGDDVPANVTEEEMLAGDSIALIVSTAGEELVAYKNFTGTQVSDVIRGVYGTAKLNHGAGATVWFLSYGFGIENTTPYQLTDLPRTVYAKLLPFNVRGVLPIASATGMSRTIVGKFAQPNPPRSLLLNDSTLPAELVADGVFTWGWQDRLVRGGRINTTANDPTPAGGTFEVRLYRGATLLRTVVGLTDRTWTYTLADQTTDGEGEVEARVLYRGADGTASAYEDFDFFAGAVAFDIRIDGNNDIRIDGNGDIRRT